MSDINLDFTVSNNSIDFTVQPNDITITPTDVQLTLNANFQPLAGGSPFQLQFNNAGILGGVANSSYTSGNLTLGDVANIKITGGTNGYVLQTDGAGNLDWTAMTGGGGNGTPGGSNTQIQYNDNGTFGGNAGFTFNEVSGNVAIPGSLAVTGNITGNIQTAYLANFATVANSVAGANVSGQVNFAATANSVAGSNVSGQVGNALIAGTVYTNAQPNITSVGTLDNLTVTGNIVGGNISGNFNLSQISNGTSNVNIATANGNISFTVNGTTTASISNTAVTARQFVSNVANGTAPFVVTSKTTVANLSANQASYAQFVTNSSQPNITSTGILNNLFVSGSYLVPQNNLTTSLGYTGQRWSSIFTGNLEITNGANMSYLTTSTSNGNGNAIIGGTMSANSVNFVSNISSNVTPSSATSTTPTHKIPIVLNGVTYYICLTSTI